MPRKRSDPWGALALEAELRVLVEDRGVTAPGVAIVHVDVDGLLNYNDAFSFDAGDALLEQLWRLLHRESGRSWYRQGGDEFTLLIADSDAVETATKIAEQVRRAVATARIATRPIPQQGIGDCVTISVGVIAVSLPCDRTVPELLSCAEAATYEAKQARRNRVYVAR